MTTPTDTSRAPAVRFGMGYYSGLDGIRALAIIAVLLYHGGVVWAGGGFLGVEAFFVLSGFLITSLLIAEWRGSATIALRAFWARRARRLLPALFCMVAVVGLYEALASSGSSLPDLRGDESRPSSTTATGTRSRPSPTTSPRPARCRRSSTHGRWRSRSSSTSCGRRRCSPRSGSRAGRCAAVGRRTGVCSGRCWR